MAFQFIKLCIFQSHILHNNMQRSERLKLLCLWPFMQLLFKALVLERRALEVDDTEQDDVLPEDLLRGRHFPAPYEEGTRKRGTCVVCTAKQKKKDPDPKKLKNTQRKKEYVQRVSRIAVCISMLWNLPHKRRLHTVIRF